MKSLKTPEALKEHEPKYNQDAWKEYTPQELGDWVHLLIKRAGHRKDAAKKQKDLTDAANYYAMLGEHLKAANAS